MKTKQIVFTIVILTFFTGSLFAVIAQYNKTDTILSYTIDSEKQELKLYWKDDKANLFKSILNLKTWLEGKQKKLVFAMNGGMYKKNHSPQGLYIENSGILSPIDTTQGKGNFYLKHNGVFYITVDRKAAICATENFKTYKNVQYATQSGPMLLRDGKINSNFTEGSTNLNIRNGVGILPDNKIVFALSKNEINFYDFAVYFKNLGCKNALYLDGFVSRAYLPEQNWIQTDGDFGVIIGVTKSQ